MAVYEGTQSNEKNLHMTEAVRIYRELKQDIVTCKVAPGTALSELVMCTRYRGSRTPVREACRRLCDETLMQAIPFRGYSIPALTIEEYRDLCELQTIVEPAAAALAAQRATEEQLKEIAAWGAFDYHAGQKNSYYTFLECNKNFHIAIVAASQNQALLEIVTNVQTRLMRYYFQVIVMDSYGGQLVEEHRQLVRAIQTRDPVLAQARAMDHLVRTVERSARMDLRSANWTGKHPAGDSNDSEWLNRLASGLTSPSAVTRVAKTRARAKARSGSRRP